MALYDMILTRRSIRQFQSVPVPREALEKMVNAARLAPSAANLQPLEFIVVDDKNLCKNLFPFLKWAAYIAPKGNPKPGKEPVAYIVVLVNTSIRDKAYERDVGAAIENLVLTAHEQGIASCWLISIDRSNIRDLLFIPESHKVDSVVALGYPDEQSEVVDYKDSIEYWKAEDGRFYVPKRRLADVIHSNRYGRKQVTGQQQ